MPDDFKSGRSSSGARRKGAGRLMPLVFKIVITVFILFWMAGPTMALLKMLSGKELPDLREMPIPFLIAILVAAIFPIAGLSGLFSIWRRRGKDPRKEKDPPFSIEPPPTPPSDAMPKRRLSLANCILPLFGTVFLLIGGFVVSMMLRQIMDQHSIEWRTTTGTVVASEVRSNNNGRGYSPHVSYRYVVDGETLTNDKLSLTEYSSTVRSDVVRHAAKYQPGAEVAVHYNLADPSESLLEPVGTTEYVLLFFPCLFILFGLLALFFGVKILLPQRPVQSFDTPILGVKLKRSGGDFGAKLLFTCVWCVFTFSFAAVWFTLSGGFSWTWDYWTFDKFFVLVFPIVGIGLAVSCVRDAVRRSRTGRYEIEIACDRLRPGARVQVTYRFNGDATRLDRVVFSVVQQSMAFQPAGSQQESSRIVHEITDPLRAQSGTFAMTIPDAIGSPRISWRLVVKYADVTNTFRLDVV